MKKLLKNRWVYLLYSCDSWKTKESMRLRGVFTSIMKLQKIIIELNEKDLIATCLTNNDIKKQFDYNEFNKEIYYIHIDLVEINKMEF